MLTGRSQLQLELTALVVNRQAVPIVTGDYELTGKLRGASEAKRTLAGAAEGSIIGVIACGGKGAAIGAGVGAGAGSEIITKGDRLKVPSETLIEFNLQQDVSIPTVRISFRQSNESNPVKSCDVSTGSAATCIFACPANGS